MEYLQIVSLSPEEWPLYKQIRLEALLMEPQAFSSRYAEVLERPDAHWQERLIEARAGEKSWLLFAKEDDRIMGLIGAYREDKSDVVEIISLYVTKEKRGQGVAAALMRAILGEVGKGSAVHKAALRVTASQTAALALYRRFGFRIVGEEAEVSGDGNAYPSYIMEKELKPA